MLDSKDPVFLNRTIQMIINWDRTTNSKKIIHIHGNKDRTIPIKNVECDYCVKDGSHMMALTRGDEITDLLNEILGN